MTLTFDLIFLFILALYFLIGWNKGVIYAVIDSVGVLAAYIVTAYFSKSLAPPIASYFGIPKVQGWIIAALVIFFSIVITVTILKIIISNGLKRHKENEDNFHLSITSKVLGSLITSTLGLIVLSIIITSYEAISGISGNDNLNLSKSRSANVASIVFNNIASSSFKEGYNQNLIKSMINKPRTTAKRARGVLENFAFRKVITSKGIIDQALAGDRFALANNKLLLAAIADQDLKLRLTSLQVIDKDLSPKDYRDLVIDQLVELGTKLKASGNDKRLRFEINELTKSGDLKTENIQFLYKNQNFQNILDILFF